MQYATGNDRIASCIFSTTRPDNLKKNIHYAMEPIDDAMVEAVRKIIGDQHRVSWANT